MQSDAPDIDIDLYADVMDSQLSLSFDDRDLFDDVVTATSDLNDETSLNTSPVETPTKDSKKSSTNVREKSNDTCFPTSPTIQQQYRIVIANITWYTSDEDITNAMVDAGVNKEDILEIKFFENRANGQSRGFCYVGFRSAMPVQFLLPMKLKEIKGNIPTIMQYNKGIITNLENASHAKSRPSFFGPNPPSYNQVQQSNAPAVQKPSVSMYMNAPNAGNNFRQHVNSGPRFQPRGPPNNFRPPQDNYNYRNPFPRGPGPAAPNCPPQNYPPNYPPGPSAPYCQRPPPPGYFRGPNPQSNMMPPRDWNGPPPNIHNNFPTREQPTTPQRNLPPFIPNDVPMVRRPAPMIEPAPISITAHVNPAFFSPGPPGVLNNSPSSTDSPSSTLLNGKSNLREEKNKDRSIHSIRRILSNNGVTGLTHDEYEDLVSRNRVVFTSAIARAVGDATAGEYLSGAETINTAIKLISESRVSQDERCQVIIDSLYDTLRALEESGNVDSRRSNRKSSSRSRERERIKQRSARSRTRSRSRDRRNDSCSYRTRRRSSERDYYRDRSRANTSRDRSRDRDRSKFQEERDRDRDRERRSYNRRFCERTDFRERDGGGPDQPQLD